MTTFKSINPYTQQDIAEYQEITPQQLQEKLNLSHKTYKSWRNTSFEERSNLLYKVAQYLRDNKTQIAQTITHEMGKIYTESLAEVEKSAYNLDYYAQNAPKLLKDTPVEMGLKKSVIAYDPIGTVFAIMPWNYPIWQVIRYLAPCIMAGNTSLLKHAPNVLGCASFIEKAFIESGAMEGLFQAVNVDIPQIESIIAHDTVQVVTLTGSEKAGSAVATLSGKHIKKSILDFGGSDAFIVLDDADIEKATTIATQSRMMNAGQACICAKRFIVTEKIADVFIDKFIQKVKPLKQGNPMQEGIHLGPLARLDLADNLYKQMENTLKHGAKLLIGGEKDACNFMPTLIDQVNTTHSIFHEETFGPLAAIVRAKTENEAIELANNHRYGLATAIWTQDLEKGYTLARKIEAGNVFINSLVRSDSRISFGGIKKSGYGRELGELGIKELCNQKTIIIE